MLRFLFDRKTTKAAIDRPPTDVAPARPFVPVSRPKGSFPDDMDLFRWMDGFEDPDKWEAAVMRAFEEAKSDQELAQLLETHYLQQDLAASFTLFRNSGVPEMIDALLLRLGVARHTPIADVGCGRDHAAHAMFKLGYKRVTAMDPNTRWYTGTGYLRSLTDHRIKIVNDLDQWKKITGEHGAIISSGTVHHWQHIPQIAIETRRTMKPGAYWLMIAEFFANSSREFIDILNAHPTATRYGSYEWAYPASAYVDLIQTAGFLLVGVIPLRYKGAKFYAGVELPIDEHADAWVDENLIKENGTVEAFWSEVEDWRRGVAKDRNYTQPQILVFQRVQP